MTNATATQQLRMFPAPAKYSNPRHYQNPNFYGIFIPAEFLATFESPYELAAFVALQAFANFESGECTPTYAEIAQTGRMSRAQAAKMLAKMKQGGWIDWTRRRYKSRKTGKNRTTSNRYNVPIAKRPTPSETPANQSISLVDRLSPDKDSQRGRQQAVTALDLKRPEHNLAAPSRSGKENSVVKKGSNRQRRPLPTHKNTPNGDSKYDAFYQALGGRDAVRDSFEQPRVFPDMLDGEVAPALEDAQALLTSDGVNKVDMFASIREFLRGRIATPAYYGFLAPSYASRRQKAGSLVIVAPNDFAAAQIRAEMLDEIRAAIESRTSEKLTIVVTT